jgi:hypothetical protein
MNDEEPNTFLIDNDSASSLLQPFIPEDPEAVRPRADVPATQSTDVPSYTIKQAGKGRLQMQASDYSEIVCINLIAPLAALRGATL